MLYAQNRMVRITSGRSNVKGQIKKISKHACLERQQGFPQKVIMNPAVMEL
jgi:hypothetical protein